MEYSQGWTISKEFEQLIKKVEESTPKEQQLTPQVKVTYSQMKKVSLALMLDYHYGKELNCGLNTHSALVGNQRKCLNY